METNCYFKEKLVNSNQNKIAAYFPPNMYVSVWACPIANISTPMLNQIASYFLSLDVKQSLSRLLSCYCSYVKILVPIYIECQRYVCESLRLIACRFLNTPSESLPKWPQIDLKCHYCRSVDAYAQCKMTLMFVYGSITRNKCKSDILNFQ